MLKGVNRQVLEITNTESPYFERILFFVRPEGQALGEGELRSEAERYAARSGKPPKARKNRKDWLAAVLYSLLGVGAGVAAVFLINLLV